MGKIVVECSVRVSYEGVEGVEGRGLIVIVFSPASTQRVQVHVLQAKRRGTKLRQLVVIQTSARCCPAKLMLALRTKDRKRGVRSHNKPSLKDHSRRLHALIL